MCLSYKIVRAEEMKILEQQSLNFGIRKVVFHCFADVGQVSFVNNFIALYIKTPVVFGRNGLECFIGFQCEYASTGAKGFVPYGADYLNLRIDTLHHLCSSIVAITNCYDEMIAYGEYRSYGFGCRVIELNCVLQK